MLLNVLTKVCSMNHILIPIVTIIVLIGCADDSAPTIENGTTSVWTYYGDSIIDYTERISMSGALDMLNTTGEAVGLFEAEIVKSCMTMGCWMSVKGGNGDTTMVFMKDHAFFVPKDSVRGKKSYFLGEAFHDTISVAMQKHLLEDAGASQVEIDAVNTPSFELAFEAAGVMIANVPEGAPRAESDE